MDQVQELKLKRLLDELEVVVGDGTSMISIVVPAGANLSKLSHKLVEEYGASAAIKSRV